jgi:hypothetical protein
VAAACQKQVVGLVASSRSSIDKGEVCQTAICCHCFLAAWTSGCTRCEQQTFVATGATEVLRQVMATTAKAAGLSAGRLMEGHPAHHFPQPLSPKMITTRALHASVCLDVIIGRRRLQGVCVLDTVLKYSAPSLARDGDQVARRHRGTQGQHYFSRILIPNSRLGLWAQPISRAPK